MTDWDDRDFRNADESDEPAPRETAPAYDEDSSSTGSTERRGRFSSPPAWRSS